MRSGTEQSWQHRTNGGLEVALFCDRSTGGLTLSVIDVNSGRKAPLATI
jgi:hypothetical protein